VAVCTFFGHHDCPETIKPKLRETLIELIKHDGVDLFYVGNQGAFDAVVRSVLRELVLEYSPVVLAYMPAKRNEYDDRSDTMLPEGIETVPRRFAVSWRMLRQADYVVTYITHSWGGAAQFAELAVKKAKKVINIAESR
jgi:hypothetical protein